MIHKLEESKSCLRKFCGKISCDQIACNSQKYHENFHSQKFVIYYIKLKSRPSTSFWSNGSPLWMQRSASNLLKMKRQSSGNTKFVFKRSQPQLFAVYSALNARV